MRATTTYGRSKLNQDSLDWPFFSLPNKFVTNLTAHVSCPIGLCFLFPDLGDELGEYNVNITDKNDTQN